MKSSRNKKKNSPTPDPTTSSNGATTTTPDQSQTAISKPPTFERQLDQKIKWILSGASQTDVTEAIQVAYPNAKPPVLLKLAIEQITAEADYIPNVVTGFCIEATRELYRKMVEIGDFSGALAAIKLLNQMTRSRR